MSFDIHEHLVDWWQLCIDSIIFIFAPPTDDFPPNQGNEPDNSPIRGDVWYDRGDCRRWRRVSKNLHIWFLTLREPKSSVCEWVFVISKTFSSPNQSNSNSIKAFAGFPGSLMSEAAPILNNLLIFPSNLVSWCSSFTWVWDQIKLANFLTVGENQSYWTSLHKFS